MKTILKQLLTGKDNETYDIGRVSWMLGIISVIVIAFYEVMHSSVSLRELAESLGIVSGASGVSIMAKKDTEPQ
jgi:hypothetical protein